jgi:bifunctional non-homologous end joining protein LigD
MSRSLRVPGGSALKGRALGTRPRRPYIWAMLRPLRFIPPAKPVERAASPAGKDWSHELKFDGWRAQMHKAGGDVEIYGSGRMHLATKFAIIRDAVAELPCKSAIVDAEVISCSADNKPDFAALMAGDKANLCACCFDLLELNGKDLRSLPLKARRKALQRLLSRAKNPRLRFSESFADGAWLLAEAEKLKLEGIVSKRIDLPYRSTRTLSWVKVKTQAWKEANRDRWKRFRR